MSDLQRKRKLRLQRQKHLQERMEQIEKEEETLQLQQTNNSSTNKSLPGSNTKSSDLVVGSRGKSAWFEGDGKVSTGSYYKSETSSLEKEAARVSSTKTRTTNNHRIDLLPSGNGPIQDTSTSVEPTIGSLSSPGSLPVAPLAADSAVAGEDPGSDSDDTFGGMSLVAKLRKFKQQQKLQNQGELSGKEDSQESPRSFQGGGIRMAKKGIAVNFSDNELSDNQVKARSISGRRRPRTDSKDEMSVTPVSHENSLNDSYDRHPDYEGTRRSSWSQNSHGKGPHLNDCFEDDELDFSPTRKKGSLSAVRRQYGTDDTGSSSNESDVELYEDKPSKKRTVMSDMEGDCGNHVSRRQRYNSDSDDAFISDYDLLERRNYNEGKSPKPKEKRVLSGSMGSALKKREKQRKSAHDTDDEDDGVHDSFRIDMEDDVGADTLKPTLENPKFGPHEPMEPLLLVDDNRMKVSVPASLNRYLAPFQQEGVRFLYNCLSRKSGAILGDEMGLGKTVQVIALLCALFGKSGTGQDLILIRERNKRVAFHRNAVRKQHDAALNRGEIVVEENPDEFRTMLGLSPWHPVLIIVPPSVMSAWEQSFQLFSHFSIAVYSDDKAKAIDSINYGNCDVLLCPKSLFQSDDHFKTINTVAWKLVVIDEFHNYKNPKAKLSVHLRELKVAHAPLVLGMTGTLMQNNHGELWNLVDLVQTNYFGTKKEFGTSVSNPIALGRQKGADKSVIERSRKVGKDFRIKLAKILIERFKKDVLLDQLPKKTEKVVFCELSKMQRDVYKHVVELPDFDLVKKANAPCDCGVNQNFFKSFRALKRSEQVEFLRNNKDRMVKQSMCCKRLPLNPRRWEDGEPKIDPDAVIWRTMDVHCYDENAAQDGCNNCPRCCAFPCMTKLMKLSSHLGLLQANRTPETSKKGSPAYVKYLKDREFAKVALSGVVSSLPGGDFDRNGGIMDDHSSLSGKFKMVEKLLLQYQTEGAKVLLFSHSTQTLDLIQNFVRSRGTWTHLRMDGQTEMSKRQALADEFNNDEQIFVFLLSTKATGQGLTLTGANRVIIFDGDWNPSWEEQAQDRAHRIGATRDVDVVRLVSGGTVEEMIYLRQIYKTHLKQDTLMELNDTNAAAPRVFRGVQGDKYRKGELFGFENIFRFKDGRFLDDIWAQNDDASMTDSSGLRIYQSDKLTKALISMGDDFSFEEKLEEEALLQEVSKRAVDTIFAGKEKTKTDSSSRALDSEWRDSESNKPRDSMIREVNHEDLFRCDKGGAAITEGEEGFDEEMGGATQDAYAIYEQRKGDFENDSKEEFVAPAGLESHETDSVDNCSGHGDESVAVEDSEIMDESKLVPSEAAIGPDAEPVATATIPSKMPQVSGMPITNAHTRQITKSSKDNETSVFGTQRRDVGKYPKKKIQLAGIMDVENAKTEFSVSDLLLPSYSKRKKRKKKST